MRAFTALIICGFLVSCSTIPPESNVARPQQYHLTALSRQQITLVEAGIRARLKDPASAKFGPLAAAKDQTGNVTVCGIVNAKNSFGGYTGDQVFEGEFRATTFNMTWMTNGTDMAFRLILNSCASKGIATAPIKAG